MFWLDLLDAIFYVWVVIIATTIVRRIIIGIKTHVFANRIDLVEKYGSWAVVTGSSDGIGKEYAKELAKRGMNIVLISRTYEKLEKVASEIERKYNVKTKIIVADFAKTESTYEHIEAQLKDVPVGVLVNNVGVLQKHFMYYSEISTEEIWKTVNVNIGATLIMTRMILPQMQSRRKGAIVNMSSTAELISWPLAGVYSGTKACVKNFTEILRYECKPYGITVQLLSPFVIKSNLTSFSQTYQNTPLSIDAQTYARNAAKTLGIVDHTTGYWLHGFQYSLFQIIPGRYLTKFTGAYNKKIRKECLAGYQQEENNDSSIRRGLKNE